MIAVGVTGIPGIAIVQEGDKLLEIDLDLINEKAVSSITLVVITNANNL